MLLGLAVGDALGVPVEFCLRSQRDKDPVTGMRAFGTHKQPAGTWSDDTSLTLCLVEDLSEGLGYRKLARKFLRWRDESYLTATGEVFDVGMATDRSIGRLREGTEPTLCGGADEKSNGNGSLMRIAPLAFLPESGEALRKTVFEVSALTHRHPRSQWACFFYVEVLKKLLGGWDKVQAIDRARWVVGKFATRLGATDEWKHFDRCRSTLASVERSELASSGYVVHTLEAALWCLLKGKTYSETVLLAVNLGDDTDTTASVAGALAGVVYGADSIPAEWLEALAKRGEIEAMADELTRGPSLSQVLFSLRGWIVGLLTLERFPSVWGSLADSAREVRFLQSRLHTALGVAPDFDEGRAKQLLLSAITRLLENSVRVSRVRQQEVLDPEIQQVGEQILSRLDRLQRRLSVATSWRPRETEVPAILIERTIHLRADGQISTGLLRLTSKSIGQFRDLYEISLRVSERDFQANGSDAFYALQALRRQLEVHNILLAIEGAQTSVRLSGMLREAAQGMQCYRMEGFPGVGTPPVVETFGDCADPDWSSLKEPGEGEEKQARDSTFLGVWESLAYFSKYRRDEPAPLLEAYHCLEQRVSEVQNIEYSEFWHQGELYRFDREMYVFKWDAGHYRASVGHWPMKLEDRRFDRAEDLVSDIVAWASQPGTGHG